MKTAILLLTLLFAGVSYSQVEEGSYDLSLGDQMGFMVDHIDADRKMVEKIMDNTFKEYGKIHKNRKAKEWSCLECKISRISGTPMDIYYKVVERKGLVTTYVFFDDGEKFLSSENASEAIESIVDLNMDIYHDVKRAVFSKELEGEEKTLKGLEKDLGKLEKKNTDLHEDIEEYKEKIRKAEQDIEKNLQQQEDKQIEIEQQKKVVSKVTDKLNNVGRGQ